MSDGEAGLHAADDVSEDVFRDVFKDVLGAERAARKRAIGTRCAVHRIGSAGETFSEKD